MGLRLSFFLLASLFLLHRQCLAQCTTIGQTPSSAFPICGNKVFQQTTVPLCVNNPLTVPGCDARRAEGGYRDKNPFWYKFTCYKSGTLGFIITPTDLSDDYDWQLYDITGHAPDDVFTNPSLTVTANWSGSSGMTGAKKGGSSHLECSSRPEDNHNTFTAMPNIIEGHEYLLLISHYTDTQSGYGLAFDGGTAQIIQTITPQLDNIRTSCDETQITLKLNKKIKCGSLAADGSDFYIKDAPPGVKITAAVAPDCGTEFDADSLILTLSGALPTGAYSLIAQLGTDGNTLLDNCDFELAKGSALPINILAKQPTPFDKIAPVSCAPQVLELVFSKRIRCATISADGSDFTITGPHPVVIDAAYGSCGTDELTSSIFLHLSQPVSELGTYTVTTQIGSDRNVIIDECGQETPADQSVPFSVKDTVSALFDTHIELGCETDVVSVSHDGRNGVTSWRWTFDSTIYRSGQTAEVSYHSYGEKTISLVTTNGFCSDTSTSVINLDNELKASFVLPDVACPNEPVVFTDSSIGNIISYRWDFGNGNNSTAKTPTTQIYPQAGGDRRYPVTLLVENNLNCKSTLTKSLFVAYSCHIAVPTAFTPNGDGINDYLYPLNAYKAVNMLFTVYNRYGQIMFQTTNGKEKWNGVFQNQPQPTGTYVWTLRFTLADTKQFVSVRGTSVLLR